MIEWFIENAEYISAFAVLMLCLAVVLVFYDELNGREEW